MIYHFDNGSEINSPLPILGEGNKRGEGTVLRSLLSASLNPHSKNKRYPSPLPQGVLRQGHLECPAG